MDLFQYLFDSIVFFDILDGVKDIISEFQEVGVSNFLLILKVLWLVISLQLEFRIAEVSGHYDADQPKDFMDHLFNGDAEDVVVVVFMEFVSWLKDVVDRIDVFCGVAYLIAYNACLGHEEFVFGIYLLGS